LDDCELPYEKLQDIDYVDMFPNWEDGLGRIFQSMGIKSVKGKIPASPCPQSDLNRNQFVNHFRQPDEGRNSVNPFGISLLLN
jgi:hypothetical protein